jgi:hypothetical protein
MVHSSGVIKGFHWHLVSLPCFILLLKSQIVIMSFVERQVGGLDVELDVTKAGLHRNSSNGEAQLSAALGDAPTPQRSFLVEPPQYRTYMLTGQIAG